MNVIIANKYKEMLMSLDIEVIKSMEGEFVVDEIINNFSNFYFDRMILDITAIKDYQNVDTLQKLSINLDMNRVILLLDDSNVDNGYLSKLISMGIYNFTRNSDGILYLLNNPNTYRDVAHLHNVNESAVSSENAGVETMAQRIIGVKSLTTGAGSTTLVHMMKKILSTAYSVSAIEVDKNDFTYFDDKDMIKSTNEELAKDIMKRRDDNVVLIDLNDFNDYSICKEVLYLIEPSTVKLNKFLLGHKKQIEQLKGEKIILTNSFVKQSEINDFESETNIKVYYNLPPLDDRKDSEEVKSLLLKLGFTKLTPISNDNKKNILGLFKF